MDIDEEPVEADESRDAPVRLTAWRRCLCRMRAFRERLTSSAGRLLALCGGRSNGGKSGGTSGWPGAGRNRQRIALAVCGAAAALMVVLAGVTAWRENQLTQEREAALQKKRVARASARSRNSRKSRTSHRETDSPPDLQPAVAGARGDWMADRDGTSDSRQAVHFAPAEPALDAAYAMELLDHETAPAGSPFDTEGGTLSNSPLVRGREMGETPTVRGSEPGAAAWLTGTIDDRE